MSAVGTKPVTLTLVPNLVDVSQYTLDLKTGELTQGETITFERSPSYAPHIGQAHSPDPYDVSDFGR